MLTPSLEDYLEEIYRFSLSLDTVRVTDISKRLKVALPSVTKALYKLRDVFFLSELQKFEQSKPGPNCALNLKICT